MSTSTTTFPASPESLLEHQDFVRSIAHSLLFDADQVDEVVQQTWLAAVRCGPRSPGAARAWLGKVVRSRASNLRRDELRRRRRESEVARRTEVEAPGPEEVFEREAVRTAVVQAVMGLGEPYRSAVLMRYFDNRTPNQIARGLGIPPATVRTRLRRALLLLRGELDARHGGDRRAWSLPLVPLAAGRRLATSLAGAQGSPGCWPGAGGRPGSLAPRGEGDRRSPPRPTRGVARVRRLAKRLGRSPKPRRSNAGCWRGGRAMRRRVAPSPPRWPASRAAS
jgi:RNA polymerase sigma-70 factor (ECF subfamily)